MKQRLTMFFACLFLSIGMALAQSRLTGTVTSAEDGQPVVGASVKAKGLNAGAVTNVDGEFTINVPVGTELEITYLGMVPKTVKAANNMRMPVRCHRYQVTPFRSVRPPVSATHCRDRLPVCRCSRLQVSLPQSPQ